MAITNADEKRHFHRILYDADATLTSTGVSYRCRIIDISLKGCLVEVDPNWGGELFETSTLTLILSDEIKICMDLVKTHAHDNHLGFKCVNVDIDSMSNLRRLVELNLGSDELIERDISSLWSEK